jgi:hypothetical protein
MRTTTAFFAGAGTIAVALAAGLGGGLLISNIVSPHAPRQGAELSKAERRTTDPIPASNAASGSSSYVEATQAAATKPVTVSPAPQAQPQQEQPQQARPQEAQPQAQQANAAPAPSAQATRPADPQQVRDANATAQPASKSQPPAPATQTAAREPFVSPDDAFAKTRDADIKREVRRAEQRRKAERRQQWAERRRYRVRQDDDLRDVEQKVREETEPRMLAAEPARVETPRIRLFGDD